MIKEMNTRICFKQTDDDYINWLIQTLGPVILGVKPAEILSFPKNDVNIADKISKIRFFFKDCRKISFKIFRYNEKSTKILFYTPKSLDSVLIDKRNNKFLISIGYPKAYSLESYLNYIIEKMKGGTIPDEIGIFLGYPLKDVMGFIGHPSLKLTKVKGWRVYGDSTLSDKRYNEFLNAKFRVKNILACSGIDTILAYT
ncbi:DUF3793 family protein [Sporosalibacterium faouarense]|uniref:DUF3793 family protein n=1 Tax=Sporosalibacterium faouarense TaxID=516123 RepID=UPI001FAF940B|nr:DUF3793 family protein [Sporosalibacterium faouarense]